MTTEREAARDMRCMGCGKHRPDVVLAHYSGLRQHLFGKGRGLKGDDRYAAPQCRECHATGPFAEGYVPVGFEDAGREIRRLIVSEEQLVQIVQWREIRHRDQLEEFREFAAIPGMTLNQLNKRYFRG